jgi:hypothetical protein
MITIDMKNVVIQTKDDLKELLEQINYIPSVHDEQYKGRTDNPNKGDALRWDLIDILMEEFDGFIGLRRNDPNLQERFGSIVEFFKKKNDEFHKTYEVIDKKENNQ